MPRRASYRRHPLLAAVARGLAWLAAVGAVAGLLVAAWASGWPPRRRATPCWER